MSAAAARNGDEAIVRAAQAIASSDRNLRLAAEYLAFAEEQGKTQRDMAKGVGKSAAWVNGLLRWRRDGYREETPFGAQSQDRDQRHDERIREEASGLGPKQHMGDESPEPKHERGASSRLRSSRTRRSRSSRRRLSEHDRTTLVRVLGMLGSSNDHEALAAARKAEALRQRLGVMWDDLLIPATTKQNQEAA